MKKIKEITTKRYIHKDVGAVSVIAEVVQQFHYDTEEEKLNHRLQMEQDGYVDSGQSKENIGTIMQAEYVWFGSYSKIIENA